MIHKLSLLSHSLFYLIAGTNHFINPTFYLSLIPDYLPEKGFINITAGIIEILLALLLLPEKTRSVAALGIVLMLVAFIPSHIFFIKVGSCIENGLCVSPIISWLRLVVLHPLLILWALSLSKFCYHPFGGINA